jgi:hypothetical protein
MRTRSKLLPGILLAALLILALPFSAFGTANGLKEGSRGDEVLDLKVRLFDLGYLQSLKDVSDRYSADTSKKVSEFQLLNGLPQTGEADRQTLEAVYSSGAVKAPLAEDRPLYNVDPDSVPQVNPEGLPLLDEQGYLPPGSSPFVYKNRDAGYWYYLSDRMSVTITRFYQAEGEIEWFEAYISYRDGGMPFSVESKNGGTALESPLKLAQEAGAVLAISDDFYQYRAKNNQRTGIVVRDGKIKADRTYTQERSRIPSLEVLALYGDGTLKTFASDAYTGQGYLDMGVTDTWAFGPALVQEGEVPRYFYSKDYRSYREPRCAVGMVKPGEYCTLVITGRKTGSRGATFGWMAERMLAMGTTEALNLDGGGTVALVFQRELLNKSENSQSNRSVSGLIAFK